MKMFIHILLAAFASFVLNVCLFNDQLIPFTYILGGLLVIVFFFYLFPLLGSAWGEMPSSKFCLYLFTAALVGRMAAAVFFYYYFLHLTGKPFEINAVDSLFYHETAGRASAFFQQMEFNSNVSMHGVDFSDLGYNYYVGLIYAFGSKSILLVRLCNAFLSALTVVFSYRLGVLLLPEAPARNAGILMLLLPNFYLYLGTHTKETLLVFLLVSSVLLATKLLNAAGRKLWLVLLLCACIFGLFLLRTVIAVAFVGGFMVYGLFSFPWKFRLAAGLVSFFFAAVLFFMVYHSPVFDEVMGYWEKASVHQTESLQFRADRDNGNKFALMAGAPLFACIIFMVPFPSFVAVEGQDMLWMFTGPNFIKNVLAFFIIGGMVVMAKNSFRKFSLVFYLVVGYLLALSSSAFAVSERFHLPVVPFLLLFAAAGMAYMPEKTKRFFPVYLALVILIQVGWNYIKMAGRT